MAGDTQDFDRLTRSHIYDMIFTRGAIPAVTALAASMGSDPAEVVAALRRMAQEHIVVLRRESDEILMASPFSAVPTAFQVEGGGHTYWGNCVWDALGILAMLKSDGRVVASCGDCNAAMSLTVTDGALVETEGVAHFSVPARRWWDDIVFT